MTDTARLVIAVDSSGAKRATDNLDKLDRASGRSEKAANKLGKAWGVAIGLISSAVIIGATRAFIRQADAMANMSAKLKLVTGDVKSATAAQRDLFDLSQKTSADLEATTELYVKLGQSSKELAGNHELLLGITEKVSKALVISGADAASSAAVIRQFSQAMAAGSLRGDEFISVMEGAPRLARAIADGLDVSVGSLRKMAAQGKLTSEAIIKALEDQGAVLDQEFGEMPLTVSRATQQVRNSLTQLIGDTDKTSGATSDLAEEIAKLARKLESQEVKDGFATMVTGLVNVASAAATAASEFANFAKWVGESAARAQGFISADDVGGVSDRLGKVNKALEQRKTLGGRVSQVAGAVGWSVLSPLQDAEEARLAGTSTAELEAERQKLLGFQDMQQKAAALAASRARWGNVQGNAVGGWERGDSGGGGSDPDKDAIAAAKRLQAAYANLTDQQRERIAMFGQEGEVAKVTYATTEGALKGLSQEKKNQLLQDAEHIDWLEEQQALEGVWADAKEEATKRWIDAENRKAEAIDEGIKSTDRLINDMQFELSLIGLSNIEREKAIALRYADAHATDSQIAKVADLAVQLEKAREAEGYINDLKGGMSDLFMAIGDGSDAASSAIDRMFDNLKRRAMDALADSAINGLIAGFASLMGGGGWAGFSTGFMQGFRGGRAGEGPVMGGQSYWVGEKGRELFTPSTNGTVSNGGGGVTVKPEIQINVRNESGSAQVSQPEFRMDGLKLVVDMVVSEVDKRIGRMESTGKAIGGRFGLAPVGR